MSRPAAEKGPGFNSARDAQVAACPRLRGPGAKSLSSAYFNGSPQGNRCAVQGSCEVRTSQRDDRTFGKYKCSAEQGHFQSGGVLCVAYQAISDSKRGWIGGAGGRNSHWAESFPSQILHGGQQPG